MSIDDDLSSDIDPFSEQRVFPDAAAVFSYRPPLLSSAKPDCVVVLDTNVLLLPYTITAKTLGEIRRTYEGLVQSGQLAIPGQVAREFARNRAQKLGELYHQLTSKRTGQKRLQTGRYPLLESVSEYERILRLEKEIDAKLTEYEKAMDGLLSTVRLWNWNDPVSVLYADLFSPAVVVETTIEESKLREDLVRRAASKLPPGYKDAAKKTNSAGDLLIWHTILEIGASRKKPVLFVSGDGKPDWWHKSSGQPLYPRYELIDEFRRASGGQAFYIAQFSEFLELFGASVDVVEEVRTEEAASIHIVGERSSELSDEGVRLLSAVGEWLRTQYPEATVRHNWQRGGAALIASTSSMGQLGVDVKFFRHPNPFSANRITREMAQRSFYELQSGAITDYLLCVVTPSAEIANEYAAVLQRTVVSGRPIKVSVGFLAEGQYKEQLKVETICQPFLFPPEA
jgi:rRNA-processing protein FCF1